MISFVQDCTAQWSDTIPSWNVQFQVRINLTLFHFNTPTKLNYDSPILDLNCSTLTTGKDLVNRLAGLLTPAIWKGSTTLFSYCSQMSIRPLAYASINWWAQVANLCERLQWVYRHPKSQMWGDKSSHSCKWERVQSHEHIMVKIGLFGRGRILMIQPFGESPTLFYKV